MKLVRAMATLVMVMGLLGLLTAGSLLLDQASAQAICSNPPCIGDGKPPYITGATQVTGNEGDTVSNSGRYGGLTNGGMLELKSGPGTLTYSPPDGDGAGTWSWSLPTTDNLTASVTLEATNDTGISDFTFTVTVNNVPPTATFQAPSTVGPGQGFSLQMSNWHDPGANDYPPGSMWGPGVGYYLSCNYPSVGFLGEASGSENCTAPVQQGTFTVAGKAVDKDGGYTVYTATVSVVMQATEGRQSSIRWEYEKDASYYSCPTTQYTATLGTISGPACYVDTFDNTLHYHYEWDYTPPDGPWSGTVTLKDPDDDTNHTFDIVAGESILTKRLSRPAHARYGDRGHAGILHAHIPQFEFGLFRIYADASGGWQKPHGCRNRAAIRPWLYLMLHLVGVTVSGSMADEQYKGIIVGPTLASTQYPPRSLSGLPIMAYEEGSSN